MPIVHLPLLFSVIAEQVAALGALCLEHRNTLGAMARLYVAELLLVARFRVFRAATRFFVSAGRMVVQRSHDQLPFVVGKLFLRRFTHAANATQTRAAPDTWRRRS